MADSPDATPRGGDEAAEAATPETQRRSRAALEAMAVDEQYEQLSEALKGNEIEPNDAIDLLNGMVSKGQIGPYKARPCRQAALTYSPPPHTQPCCTRTASVRFSRKQPHSLPHSKRVCLHNT